MHICSLGWSWLHATSSPGRKSQPKTQEQQNDDCMIRTCAPYGISLRGYSFETNGLGHSPKSPPISVRMTIFELYIQQRHRSDSSCFCSFMHNLVDYLLIQISLVTLLLPSSYLLSSSPLPVTVVLKQSRIRIDARQS